jgi:predicted 2-oxoglutarate/Fe(II)-dependent dioxygenase YbiX
MFIRIKNLLSDEHLAFIDNKIAVGDFTDGTVTTGGPSKAVKKNLQIEVAKHLKRDKFLRMNSFEINSQSLVRLLTLNGLLQDEL